MEGKTGYTAAQAALLSDFSHSFANDSRNVIATFTSLGNFFFVFWSLFFRVPAPEEFHTHTCMCSIDITYEKFDTPHENSYLSTLSCSRRLLDSMHCRELSCLCVSGFSNLFQFITPAFGPNGWKDVGVHCPDFFSLFILLTPWDLH